MTVLSGYLGQAQLIVVSVSKGFLAYHEGGLMFILYFLLLHYIENKKIVTFSLFRPFFHARGERFLDFIH